MKLLVTATSLCFALAAGTAFAAEPTEKDAIAMVERGVALVKAKGKDEMMKRINAKDPDFVQGSLYIDMRDLKSGIVLAHPINPSIVGKDLTDVPDASGKKYRREIIELAAKSNKGWVDYQYKNPTSGKIEPKTTYIQKVEDVVLEAGIYKK
ncbi:MAG: cache domain-containing protein [Telluria sp.]